METLDKRMKELLKLEKEDTAAERQEEENRALRLKVRELQIEEDGYSDIHDVDVNTLKDYERMRIDLKEPEIEESEEVSSALSFDTFDPNPDTE